MYFHLYSLFLFSVPKLNLGRLAADEDRMVNIPDPYDYELDTPDTSSTVR